MSIKKKKSVNIDQEKMANIRKETVKEINKDNKENRLKRNKKIIKITLLIIVVFTIVKLIWGSIELSNIMGYPSSSVRYYDLKVNGEKVNTHYTIRHKITLFPYLIHFNSYKTGSYELIDIDNDTDQYLADGYNKYILSIDSYKCYKDSYQVECKNDLQKMKKTKDTRYTQVIITRTSNPYEEVYNGKFINDITEYVSKKGVYSVEVIAKHSLVETTIQFYFKQK